MIPDCKLWLDSSFQHNGVKSGNSAQYTALNSEYLSIADNAALSMGDIDFTIAGWVYFDVLSGTIAIFSQENSGTVREYRLDYFSTTDRFRFLIFDSSGNSVGIATANNLGIPAIQTWYFFVLWHNATANTVNIQINNGTVNSVATTGIPSDTTAGFRIGAKDSIPTSFLTGRSHDVIIAKQIYTAAERTFLYNDGNGRQLEELGIAGTDGANINVASGGVAYFKLGEESGTRADSWGANTLTDNATVTQNDGVSLKDPVDGDNVRQATDLSGNENDAVGTGNVTTKPLHKAVQINGKPAISFDNVDDVLTITQNSSINDLAAMTIFAVIKPTTVGTSGRILHKSDGVIDNGWLFFLQTTNAVRFIVDYATTDLERVSANNAVTMETSMILALTWDGSATATNIHIYLNGTEVSYGTPINGVGDRVTDAGSNLYIGNEPGGTRTFDGLIAEPSLHNRVMNAGELKRAFRYYGRKYGIAVS